MSSIQTREIGTKGSARAFFVSCQVNQQRCTGGKIDAADDETVKLEVARIQDNVHGKAHPDEQPQESQHCP